jgi:hypothetical protein
VAIMSLPGDEPKSASDEGDVGGYSYRLSEFRKGRRGRMALSTTEVELENQKTGARYTFAACAFSFGEVDMHCVLRPLSRDTQVSSLGPAKLSEGAIARVWAAFEEGSLLTLVRVAEEELGPEGFGLEHLLEEAREAVSGLIFEEARDRYAAQYEAMYQDARRVIGQFHAASLTPPEELRAAAGLALAHRFDEEIGAAPTAAFQPEAYSRARAIAKEARRYGCTLRHQRARTHLDGLLTKIMYRVCAGDDDVVHVGTDPTRAALSLIELATELGVTLDRERPQELLVRALHGGMDVTEPLRELVMALGLSTELLVARQ